MGKLLEQRNRALDDINAGRTVKKIRDLESRVRELEEDNARLKAECDDIKQAQFPRKLEAVAVGWKKQLATSQAYAEQLRELIKRAHEFVRDDLCNDGLSSLMEALAIPTDTSALDAYVSEKVLHLQEEHADLCRMNAEATLLAKELTRQRDLAVDALRASLDALRLPCDRWNKNQSMIISNALKIGEDALFTIKGEAKE